MVPLYSLVSCEHKISTRTTESHSYFCKYFTSQELIHKMATKTITSENLDRTYLPSTDDLSMGNNQFLERKEDETGKGSFNCTNVEPFLHHNAFLAVDYVNQVARNISADPPTFPPHETNIIVVIPSIDFDEVELQRINKVVGFYEERQLYHLFLLQDPSYRVVYLSSHPIAEEIVRYYVSLNCKYEFEVDDRLSRLSLLTIKSMDPSYKSLCAKVCQSREWVQLIANEIRPFSIPTQALCRTGLSVFTGSQTADQLAHLLGIRLLEAGSEMAYFGTKQGR